MFAGLVLLAIAIGMGLMPRLAQQKALASGAAEEARRPNAVRVATVELAGASSELELSCDLQALIESPILAQTEGYISKRLGEIGAQVTKGQLLAELETPALNQQLAQMRASLSQSRAALQQVKTQVGQTRAQLQLAKVTRERWQELVDRGVLSLQDADEKKAVYEVRAAEAEAAVANVRAAEEAVHAAEANVKRLEEQQTFSQLRAPFDGLITYRNPDVGTLISAGANGRELFRVADITTIRAFISVPQAYVPYIVKGLAAELTVDDIPGRKWAAPVSNIANSLDLTTRTMLALVKVSNPDLVLKPGMYGRVRFRLPSPPKSLILAGDAVIGRGDGTYVAALDSASRVHFRRVTVERDFGTKVAISSGVSAGDRVVLSPGDDVREGTVVETREAK